MYTTLCGCVCSSKPAQMYVCTCMHALMRAFEKSCYCSAVVTQDTALYVLLFLLLPNEMMLYCIVSVCLQSAEAEK